MSVTLRLRAYKMRHDHSDNSPLIKPLKLPVQRPLYWLVSSFSPSTGEDVGAQLLPYSTAGYLCSFSFFSLSVPTLSLFPQNTMPIRTAPCSGRSDKQSYVVCTTGLSDSNCKLLEGRGWGLFSFASSELEPKSRPYMLTRCMASKCKKK